MVELNKKSTGNIIAIASTLVLIAGALIGVLLDFASRLSALDARQTLMQCSVAEIKTDVRQLLDGQYLLKGELQKYSKVGREARPCDTIKQYYLVGYGNPRLRYNSKRIYANLF